MHPALRTICDDIGRSRHTEASLKCSPEYGRTFRRVKGRFRIARSSVGTAVKRTRKHIVPLRISPEGNGVIEQSLRSWGGVCSSHPSNFVKPGAWAPGRQEASSGVREKTAKSVCSRSSSMTTIADRGRALLRSDSERRRCSRPIVTRGRVQERPSVRSVDGMNAAGAGTSLEGRR